MNTVLHDNIRNVCIILVLIMFFCFLLSAAGAEESRQYAEYNGLSIIEIDGRQGAVNHDNHAVIPPVYDLVSFCDQGTVRVILRNKWGLFRKDGDMILPVEYDYISDYTTPIQSDVYGYAYYEKDGKIGYIYGNEVLTEPVYDKTYAPLSVDASNALRASLNDHPILLDAHKTEAATTPLTAPTTGEIVFYTDYDKTTGYDIQDFAAKPIVQKELSQEGALSLLQLIHRNTIWLRYTDDCYKRITDIGYLDVYPYFKRGITRYDYWHEDICDVIYINAYGDVLQIAHNCYEEAWMLWDMEW